jgi:hypothetical protein
VVSFTSQPFYPQGKIPWYPLNRRLGVIHSCSSLRSKYSPKHPVLIHPQPMRDHSYKTHGKIAVFYILIFKFLERRQEDKKL